MFAVPRVASPRRGEDSVFTLPILIFDVKKKMSSSLLTASIIICYKAIMNVKKLRLALGLTQAEMAHRLGVSPVTVNRWERGKVKKPSPLAERRLQSLTARAAT